MGLLDKILRAGEGKAARAVDSLDSREEAAGERKECESERENQW